jgi:hypothetical protein
VEFAKMRHTLTIILLVIATTSLRAEANPVRLDAVDTRGLACGGISFRANAHSSGVRLNDAIVYARGGVQRKRERSTKLTKQA